MSKETPCIAVCMIDPKTSLCFGCGRTLPEIARWHRMDSAEREAVMALLPARMTDASLVRPAVCASLGAALAAEPNSASVGQWRRRGGRPACSAVRIARGPSGEFALQA